MKNTENISGIILCGGKSKRMGKNKALLMLEEKHVIAYVIELLAQLCNNLLISTNSKDLDFLKIKTVPDEFQNIGPIAGILSALKQSKTDKNIILSCDTPFINKDIVKYMLANSKNYDVVLPVFNEHLQPMTGIFSKNIIPLIENEIKAGNFIPPRIFEKGNLNKLKIDKNLKGWHKHLFFNINNPTDYEKAKEIIKNISG